MSLSLVSTRAPHRIGFFGGGTDLPEISADIGGAVLNMAINKYVYVTVKKHSGFFHEKYRIQYSRTEVCDHVEQIENQSIRSVLVYFNIDTPLIINTFSDLPSASGMGSSSTLIVALIAALNRLFDLHIPTLAIAETAFLIERSIPGNYSGRQDMYAATFGGVNLFQFENHISCKHLHALDHFRENILCNLRLYWTGIARSASDILYQQISESTVHSESYVLLRDMAVQAYELLLDPSDSMLLHKFANLLTESTKLKYSLASCIYPAEINSMMSSYFTPGLLASKLLGAGGGGFLMCLYNSPGSFPPPEVVDPKVICYIDIDGTGVTVMQEA